MFSVDARVSFGTTKLGEKLYIMYMWAAWAKTIYGYSVIKESFRLDSQANPMPEHSKQRHINGGIVKINNKNNLQLQFSELWA